MQKPRIRFLSEISYEEYNRINGCPPAPLIKPAKPETEIEPLDLFGAADQNKGSKIDE